MVTYADGNIVAEKAIEVLGVAKTRYKDGVALMETEAEPATNDVLHFENLGVSRLSLSAQEAKNIAGKPEILAVEEDVDVFALYDDYTEGDIDDPEDILTHLGQNTSDDGEFDEDMFPEELMTEGKSLVGKKHFKDRVGRFVNYPTQSYTKKMIIRNALIDLSKRLSVYAVGKRQRFSAREILPLVHASLNKQIPNNITVEQKFQAIPWNISMVQAPNAWRRKIDGRGVKVAVLDTGIARHLDLTICGGASFVPGVSDYDDDKGHGTHCAGIIAAKNNGQGVVGVAPNAMLYAVKVLNSRGKGEFSTVIAGLEWCIRHKMNVASMSLGASEAPLVSMATIIRRCQDNGMTVVVAAGNSYGTSFPWVEAPANSFMQGVPNASPIAVGAVDRNGRIADFSSRGTCVSESNPVTCVAPGYSVQSTFLNNSYVRMSGTSMACPHVAGLAALIIQRYPGITPAQVKRLITNTSIDLGVVDNDETFGFGLINCDEATR